MPEDSKKELTEELRRAIDRSFGAKEPPAGGQAPPAGAGKGGRVYGRFSGGVDEKRIEAFSRELSILLGSGVDLLGGLKLLAGRESDPALRKVLGRVASLVEQGSSLWQALSKFPRVFPSIYISSIKAGETSGRLEFALDELCRFYEFEMSAKKKLKTVLTYPAAVLVLSVIVLIVLSATILPVFREMLSELGAETPAVINMLYVVGGFITGYWAALILLVVFLLVLPKLLRIFPGGAMLMDRFKLRIPFFGRFVLRIIISRFSRNLAILLSSGVKITEALDTSAETTGNMIVAGKLRELRAGIEAGESLESVLREPGVFPPLLVDMLVVGEQSGELEAVLNRVADVYSREAEDSITAFASVLEPGLILFMGVIVAFVFVSLFLPYVEIIAAMGGQTGF